MSSDDKRRRPILQGGQSGQFGRSSQIIRNAMNQKGGFGNVGQPQSQKKSRKPQATKRYNIRIERKEGGFAARVSVGAFFGKHKDYLGKTLSELFPNLEDSAKRVFAAGATNVAQEDIPDIMQVQRAAPEPEIVDEPAIEAIETTTCSKCGATVGWEKWCGECGTKAPAKPEPTEEDLTQCSKCSAPVPWSKHCMECGTKAPDKPAPAATAGNFCGDCGSKVPEGKKFCTSCGAKL